QLASAAAALTSGQATRVTMPLDSLVVPANDSVSVVVAVLLSGRAPNLTGFSATLVPEATHTLGVRSLAADQLGTGNSAVASSNAPTTVLQANEIFALSENPVRHGHVVFNFSQRPTLASVYSLSGRRVADLLQQMTTDGRVDWQLRNDDGGTVANGIYLVVFNVGGQVIRQKLFIARPQE
ncbi:MAG TPA: T9SS type A sorting domain-containing protein, partial [Longimicrobiales bacterium]